MILQQPIAFVDVETTGTDPQKHEIIELGVVIARLKDNVLTVIDQMDVKIAPKHIETAEPQALRVNGFDPADWLFAAGLEETMKIFSDKTEGAVFAAHNLTFDYSFIEHALRQCNVENKMHFQKIDTLSIAFGVMHVQDDMSKLSLRALCEHYCVENKNAHSAFSDAYATYEVFKKLLKLK